MSWPPPEGAERSTKTGVPWTVSALSVGISRCLDALATSARLGSVWVTEFVSVLGEVLCNCISPHQLAVPSPPRKHFRAALIPGCPSHCFLLDVGAAQ